MYSIIFFFFKQKTAYEMRISDWSSDVCSSDLAPERYPAAAALRLAPGSARTDGIGRRAGLRSGDGRGAEGAGQRRRDPHQHQGHDDPHSRRRDGRPYRAGAAGRSEEHTSELQSLMRSSYAVFCLKKKKHKTAT